MTRVHPVYVVLVIVLVVSVGALAVLLMRAQTQTSGHDLASIPNELVLSHEAVVAQAQLAIEQFQARADNTLQEMDHILAKPGEQLSAIDVARLTEDMQTLVVLRHAVAGTGAALEERLASDSAGPSLGVLSFGLTGQPAGMLADASVNSDLTSGIIDTYSQFASEFDTAVNKMIKDASGGSATSGASSSGAAVTTAQLTTDAMVVQAKQSLRDTVSGAAASVMSTLKKLSQQLGS